MSSFVFVCCRKERVRRVRDQALAGHDNQAAPDHSPVAQTQAGVRGRHTIRRPSPFGSPFQNSRVLHDNKF
jgi:hypothetical protein